MAPQHRIDVISAHLTAQPVVLLQKIEGKIAVITLNRPNKLNAINRETITELTRILGILDRDPNVYVIVLTGSGKVFSSGTDLKRYKDPLHIEMQSGGRLEEYWELLHSLHKPLIAAVSGFVYGDGFELALMCDVMLASESAKFRLNGIRAGVIPDSYAVQSLTKCIGKHRTMQLVLTGRLLPSSEAASLGLCRVVKGNVVSAAVEMGKKMATLPSATLVAAKAAVKQGFETGFSAGLQAEQGLGNVALGVDMYAEPVKPIVKRRK